MTLSRLAQRVGLIPSAAQQRMVVGSSQWWLARLGRALDARAQRIAVYEDYYRGNHRLIFQSSKFREAFGALFQAFADNFCGLVVDAVEERMHVEGFRMGADLGQGADDDTWAAWQENNLDSQSSLGHLDALVKGVSYGMVAPSPKRGANPLITIESGLDVITEASVDGTRSIRAGMKRWVGDDGRLNATLYFPESVEKWVSQDPVPQILTMVGTTLTPAAAESVAWVRREVRGENWPLPNPIGAVPIVPIFNKPRLADPDGRSELADVIPIQDWLNKTVADLIILTEFGAYPQRWATGIEIPTDPDTGQPIETFKAAVDRLWIVPPVDQGGSYEPKFGAFPVADPVGLVAVVETVVKHLSSTTRTPAHYFLGPGGVFPSGEAIKSSEEGLVYKVKSKQRHTGESWEQLIRLYWQLRDPGDARGLAMDSETIWRDPETHTESAHVDATVKKVSIGWPRPQAWLDVGASPQQVKRWLADEEAAKAVGDAGEAPELAPGVTLPATLVLPDGTSVPAAAAPAVT
jgi:hypothetical protein